MNDQVGASEGRRDDLSKGFQLGQFTIFPDQFQIIPLEGDPVRVEAKAMAVLVELAKHPHQVVSIDHFMETVWPDRFVEIGNLQGAISTLRNALGCSPRTPKFIKTHQSRGYELIRDVGPLRDEAGTDRPAPDDPAPDAKGSGSVEPQRETSSLALKRPVLRLLAATAVAAALILGYIWFKQVETSPPAIAVMPFTAPESEDLPVSVLGIYDYLLQALTDADDLTIVARSDIWTLPPDLRTAEEILDQLSADYLISGQVYPEKEQISLTLTVEDAESRMVSNFRVGGDPSHPVDFQERALIALSEVLERKLEVKRLTVPEVARTMDDAAHLKFLEAQTQWHQRDRARIDGAIRLLREAIELRPSYAEAHLALAQIVAIRPFYGEPEPLSSAYAEARQSLDKVAQMTDRLDSEVAALRGAMAREEHRWQEALDQLEQALALKPDNAMAHYWYATLLCNLGRYEEALVSAREAARLNPFSSIINNRLVLTYLWVGDNQAADRRFTVASGVSDRDGMKIALLNAVRNEDWPTLRGLLLLGADTATWVDPLVETLSNPQSDLRNQALTTIDAAITNGQIPETLHFPIWWILGEADRAVAEFDPTEMTQDIEMLWAPEAAALRQHPGFPDLLASVGLTGFVEIPNGQR
jgi:DNA-binding winged helix-turn-helix (wHTH) protein/Tfp pilus assembly protein PilF/TolB-like protein